MSPPTPEHEAASLGVVLWRLDTLDRNVSRLVSADSHAALERRVDRLEREDELDEAWRRNLTAGVILAALSAGGSLLITLIG